MSINYTSSSVFPITALPTELLVRVLFHLDGYSLNSVLEAVSEVCQRCILITDRPKRALFVAQGLRVVQLNDLETTPTAQFIKLYEIEDYHGYLVNTFGTDRLKSTPFYRSLGSFSFVHFATPHSGMPRVCHLIHQVFLTGATAEISHCPAGRIITGSGSTVGLESQMSQDDTSIILKGFTHVQSFRCPQQLQSLTVVFSNCGDETPSLHGIDFRDGLPRHLKIVYYGRFPEVYDNNVSCNKYGCPIRVGSVLELVHAPSMKTHIEGPLHIASDYEHAVSERTISFFQGHTAYCSWMFALNFLRINVIGGPTILYRQNNLCSPYPKHAHMYLAHLHIKQTFFSRSTGDALWGAIIKLEVNSCLALFSYESSFLAVPPIHFLPGKYSRSRRAKARSSICSSVVYHTTRVYGSQVMTLEEREFNTSYISGKIHHVMFGCFGRSTEKAVHFRDLEERQTHGSSQHQQEPDLLLLLQAGLTAMMTARRRRYMASAPPATIGLSAVGFDPAAYIPDET